MIEIPVQGAAATFPATASTQTAVSRYANQILQFEALTPTITSWTEELQVTPEQQARLDALKAREAQEDAAAEAALTPEQREARAAKQAADAAWLQNQAQRVAAMAAFEAALASVNGGLQGSGRKLAINGRGGSQSPGRDMVYSSFNVSIEGGNGTSHPLNVQWDDTGIVTGGSYFQTPGASQPSFQSPQYFRSPFAGLGSDYYVEQLINWLDHAL